MGGGGESEPGTPAYKSLRYVIAVFRGTKSYPICDISFLKALRLTSHGIVDGKIVSSVNRRSIPRCGFYDGTNAKFISVP